MHHIWMRVGIINYTFLANTEDYKDFRKVNSYSLVIGDSWAACNCIPEVVFSTTALSERKENRLATQPGMNPGTYTLPKSLKPLSRTLVQHGSGHPSSLYMCCSRAGCHAAAKSLACAVKAKYKTMVRSCCLLYLCIHALERWFLSRLWLQAGLRVVP